ncbi:Hypothetical predicted protein [Olea europaea subsp. europaea]|uniref:Uncharacterized protein n=1 Tax=Olea europaea subsp. europaea TaxID=158383 RepID=A0A8S0UTI8_OLEEU|nr:Hypothetical predicted protein [Olea europaea subsp. europaea]
MASARVDIGDLLRVEEFVVVEDGAKAKLGERSDNRDFGGEESKGEWQETVIAVVVMDVMVIRWGTDVTFFFGEMMVMVMVTMQI